MFRFCNSGWDENPHDYGWIRDNDTIFLLVCRHILKCVCVFVRLNWCVLQAETLNHSAGVSSSLKSFWFARTRKSLKMQIHTQIPYKMRWTRFSFLFYVMFRLPTEPSFKLQVSSTEKRKQLCYILYIQQLKIVAFDNLVAFINPFPLKIFTVAPKWKVI